MKISLRGMGSNRLIRKLEKKGLASLVGGTHTDLFFDAAWPSEDLDEFLRKAARYGSFDLNPWMSFTPAEVKRARFLHIRPRKTIEDSNADYEKMQSHVDGLPWIGDDPTYRCKLPEEISLSRRISLKPNQVASVGQWTVEYVIPHAVRKLFEEAGFNGAEYRPVANTRTGDAHEGYWHLFCTHLLPPRVIDIGTQKIESSYPEEQGYDVMGCFCYEPESLDSALDFNRTGEANVGFQFPEWIVSAEVRDVFAANKLKGWAFEPVLETGTDEYDRYTQLWSSLYELLAACSKHTVRGQRVAEGR